LIGVLFPAEVPGPGVQFAFYYRFVLNITFPAHYFTIRGWPDLCRKRALGLLTKDETYRVLFRLLARERSLGGRTYGMGVVSAFVMSYQFGYQTVGNKSWLLLDKAGTGGRTALMRV